MGYDVSFHPISPDEIQEWYFTPLTWIQQGQEEKVLALAAQHGIEDFYCRQEISRGDIYYADLRPVIGSEQGGIRPVLILQNNVGNRHSPTVIAAPITSKMGKPRLPTHVCLNRQANGLSCGSVILLEQLRTIDKSRLRERVGALDTSEMKQIDWALGVSVGLVEGYR